MNKSCIFLVACLSALGGCTSVARQNAFPQRYALGPAASQIAPPPQAQPRRMTLQVARVEMPAWLRGEGMYYRLDYGNRQRVAAYADSAWVAPPAEMLQQLVRNMLAADGTWHAVVGPGSDARAQFILRVDVEDFSQVFTSPQTSFGVLDAAATLVDAHNAKVIAQRSFHLRIAAPSADAAGGAAALGATSQDFTRQLQAWLRMQPAGKP